MSPTFALHAGIETCYSKMSQRAWMLSEQELAPSVQDASQRLLQLSNGEAARQPCRVPTSLRAMLWLIPFQLLLDYEAKNSRPERGHPVQPTCPGFRLGSANEAICHLFSPEDEEKRNWNGVDSTKADRSKNSILSQKHLFTIEHYNFNQMAIPSAPHLCVQLGSVPVPFSSGSGPCIPNIHALSALASFSPAGSFSIRKEQRCSNNNRTNSRNPRPSGTAMNIRRCAALTTRSIWLHKEGGAAGASERSHRKLAWRMWPSAICSH